MGLPLGPFGEGWDAGSRANSLRGHKQGHLRVQKTAPASSRSTSWVGLLAWA